MGGFWARPRCNNALRRAALGFHENVLTLQRMEYPFVLDLKAPTIGVLNSMLPLSDPFEQWPYKPLMASSIMVFGGMYFHCPNPYEQNCAQSASG